MTELKNVHPEKEEVAIVPDDRPLQSASEGDGELRRLLTYLDGAVRERQQAFFREANARVIEPLREALEAAAAESAEISGPEAGSEVGERVIAPLRERIDAISPAENLAEAWRRMLADLEALGSELPETIVRPEPEKLYAPEPGDPLSWKLQKAGERHLRGRAMLRHRLSSAGRRLLRRDPPKPPEYFQEVPFARLAGYHLKVRLPGAQRALLAQLQRVVADSVSRVERVLMRWTHELLDERSVEAPKNGERVGDPGAALLEAAQALSVEPVETEAETLIATAAESLALDARRAGSFMLDLGQRSAVAEPPPAATADTAAWAEWHRQVVGRLALAEHMLRFRADLSELEAREVREVLEAGAEPVRSWIEEAAGKVQALSREAVAAFDAADAEAPLHGLLKDILDRATKEVEARLLTPLRSDGVEEAAQAAADAAVSALYERISELPAELSVHMLAKGGAGGDPNAEVRTVRLRDLASQTFDAVLVERLRTAAAPVGEMLGRVRGEASGVPAILRYNLEAAIEELQRPAPEGVDERATSARELAVGGLTRSAEVLTGLAAHLDELPPSVSGVVRDAISRGWLRLHERVRQEGRVQEQLLGLRTRLATESRELIAAASTRLLRGRTVALQLVRRGRRGAAALVQIGQTAVGTAQLSEQEAHRTIEVLDGVGALMERFPLVYRRLFSFEPLRDEDLVENRRVDRAFAESHFDRWQRGLGAPLVLTAYYGNGLTSFVNSLRRTVFADATQYELELRERVTSEDRLAALIAGALGLWERAGEEPPASLEVLAAGILRRPPAERPEVCVIEHLELLMLRTSGGTELQGKLLAFIAQTGRRILWVCTAADHAWRYVEQVEPVSARLVIRHRLTPMDRPAQELLVLGRHQRSGLPVVFDEPEEMNPIQRRRLKRARTARERQAMLQEMYFERLFRAAGESIRLALFYWLHSAELQGDEVHVRPVRPFNFGFLRTLPLSHGFAMQALLQHGSLTLDEHAAIFQKPVSESYEIFEALYALRVIEEEGGTTANGRSIRIDARYRLRPLLAHPVLQYLEGKHLVY